LQRGELKRRLAAGGGGVGLLHERGEDCLHDAGRGLVRDRVVHDQVLALLLHHGLAAALADVLERGRQVG
jgi:hypothetical protein